MAVHTSPGLFEPGSITRTRNGGTGEKTHETNANGKIDISTRMVKQDSCGGVFHIRFPRICGIEQRTIYMNGLQNP